MGDIFALQSKPVTPSIPLSEKAEPLLIFIRPKIQFQEYPTACIKILYDHCLLIANRNSLIECEAESAD